MKTILCVGMICLAYLIAGSMEYADKKAAELERKSLNEGRIWSKKCAAKNQDVLAVKKDQEKWKVICVEKRTLKV